MSKQPTYDQPRSSRLTHVLAGIALCGVALLLFYIIIVPQQTYTPTAAILSVLRGLAGELSLVLPLLMFWFGIRAFMKLADHPFPASRIAADILLALLLLTEVELFSAPSIMAKLTVQEDYFNFVANAYVYNGGGGALGALLAYPVHRYLGAVLGTAVLAILALLLLAAMGRIQKFVEWIRQRNSGRMFKTEEEKNLFGRRPRPAVDNRYDELDDAPRRPVAQPARRNRSVDEYFESRKTSTMPRRDPLSDDLRNEGGAKPKRPTPPRAKAKAVDEEELERVAKRTAPKQPPRTPKKPASKKLDEVNDDPNVIHVPPKAELPAAEPTDDGENAFDSNPLGSKRKTSRLTPDEMLEKYGKIDDEPLTSNRKKRSVDPDEILSRPRKPRTDEDAFEEIGIGSTVTRPRRDDDAPFNPLTAPKRQPKVEEEPKPKKAFPKLVRPEPVEIDEDGYNYPPIDLLQAGGGVTENHDDHDREIAETLIDTLEEFGIECSLVGIAHGPAVTRFELNPARGIKLSRITALSDDIAMRLAAISVRIEAPIPGKAAVGVEIPNQKVETVHLRDVLESANARKMASKIAVGLGKDNGGNYILADIAKMPHVLIAGQTGSGKSVCINSIIASILYRATPDEVRLILIDPKVVELSIYNDIPHLVCPVVTDAKKAASALDWAVAEMSTRYKRFAERGVRDIKGYNKALQDGEMPMPQMVIVIDELADLMMVAPGEVEDSICRLAQLARAAGMHLVIATQRPSVNVITGTIKANIPTRIAFSVASQIDSRTMIDHGGAEKLLGNGDMLYVPSGINKPMRVQGSWVSDEEIHAVVTYIKQNSETTYDEDMIEQIENAVKSDAEKEEISSEYDPRLPEAVEIVVEAGQASVSMLQRRMRVGYARAGRLIDEMEQRGIVSEADGAKPRSVLITRDDMAVLFEDAPTPEE